MIKVFSSPFRVTQKYGERPEYYKQFGLAGHEGLDLVPTDSDWTIFSLPYKGQVIKDVDMADKGGAYGIHGTIWYPDINEAWEYCHMSSNKIYVGEELSPCSPIGIMGSTGNTQGAHLHLNRFEVDAACKRKNTNNGFLGGIDPLPFLMQNSTEEPTTPMEDTYKVKGIASLDAYRSARQQGPEGNWEGYANALMGSDRDSVALQAKMSELQAKQDTLLQTMNDTIKAVQEQAKVTCDLALTENDKKWQKVVASANQTALKDYSRGELLSAFLSRLFRG